MIIDGLVFAGSAVGAFLLTRYAPGLVAAFLKGLDELL